MSRAMTPAEKTAYKAVFKSLDVDKVVVTGERTPAYNCIAWTIGITTTAIWPGDTLAKFDAFYNARGFIRTAGSGPIAVWAYSDGTMTHGCISGAGHGPRWESKCGPQLRIQHGLTELNGPPQAYGDVVAFYSPKTFFDREDRLNLLMAYFMEENPKISDKEIEDISGQTRQLSDELVTAYNRAFGRWKETWFSGRFLFDSNPASRKQNNEFYELVKLGVDIIPLLIRSMTEEDNFLALQAYEYLQQDRRVTVTIAPEDDRILEGEQGRARRTVRAYLKNL